LQKAQRISGCPMQSSSIVQVVVQMLGLSMMVRSSGVTAVHLSEVAHSESPLQGSPKFAG